MCFDLIVIGFSDGCWWMGNGEGYLRVEKVRVVGWVVAVDR